MKIFKIEKDMLVCFHVVLDSILSTLKLTSVVLFFSLAKDALLNNEIEEKSEVVPFFVLKLLCSHIY